MIAFFVAKAALIRTIDLITERGSKIDLITLSGCDYFSRKTTRILNKILLSNESRNETLFSMSCSQ